MAEFLANVNHELRTPLTSILGYAETIVGLKAEDEPLRQRCLEVIQRHADHMHTLVRDLLHLSRVESDMPLEMQPVCLRGLVDEVAEFMLHQMEEKGQRLDNTLPQDLRVMGNRHLLSQVFRNLVENASLYSPPNTRIHVSAVYEEEYVCIRVRDQGPGVAEDEIDKIFERFYRGRQHLHQSKSTGIGLSICRRVIQRHGGDIWAENMEPGMAICFVLPLSLA